MQSKKKEKITSKFRREGGWQEWLHKDFVTSLEGGADQYTLPSRDNRMGRKHNVGPAHRAPLSGALGES